MNESKTLNNYKENCYSRYRAAAQNKDIQFFPSYLRQCSSNFSFFKRSRCYAFIIPKRPHNSLLCVLEKLGK